MTKGCLGAEGETSSAPLAWWRAPLERRAPAEEEEEEGEEGDEGAGSRSASRRRPLKWAPTADSIASSTALSGMVSASRRRRRRSPIDRDPVASGFAAVPVPRPESGGESRSGFLNRRKINFPSHPRFCGAWCVTACATVGCWWTETVTCGAEDGDGSSSARSLAGEHGFASYS